MTSAPLPGAWVASVQRGMPRACGVIQAAVGSASPEAALRGAAPLGVWPFVVAFGGAAGWSLPGDTASRWREHLAALAALRALRQTLNGTLSGLRWLLLKGDLMSRALFESPWARSSSDIDVLVHPEDLAECFTRLQALGYEPAHRFNPLGNNQLAFTHPNLRIDVEVHWCLEIPAWPQPSTDRLLQGALCDPTDQTPYPDAVGLGLMTGLHFVHHQGALKPLVEWAAWWDRFGQTHGDALWKEAQALGLSRLFGWGAGAVTRLSGEPCGRFQAPCSGLSVLTARLVEGCLESPAKRPWLRMVKDETHRWQTALIVASQLVVSLELDKLGDRARAWGRVLVLGPHRVGRRVERALERCGCSPSWVAGARRALA